MIDVLSASGFTIRAEEGREIRLAVADNRCTTDGCVKGDHDRYYPLIFRCAICVVQYIPVFSFGHLPTEHVTCPQCGNAAGYVNCGSAQATIDRFEQDDAVTPASP